MVLWLSVLARMLPLIVALLAHELHVLAWRLVSLVLIIVRVVLWCLADFRSVIWIFALWGMWKLRNLLVIEKVGVDISLVKIYWPSSCRQSFVRSLIRLVSRTTTVTIPLTIVLWSIPPRVLSRCPIRVNQYILISLSRMVTWKII